MFVLNIWDTQKTKSDAKRMRKLKVLQTHYEYFLAGSRVIRFSTHHIGNVASSKSRRKKVNETRDVSSEFFQISRHSDFVLWVTENEQ